MTTLSVKQNTPKSFLPTTMAFFNPSGKQHGRISAVTASRLLHRMIDAGSEDEGDGLKGSEILVESQKRRGRGRSKKSTRKKVAKDAAWLEELAVRNAELEAESAKMRADFDTLTQNVAELVKEKEALRERTEKAEERAEEAAEELKQIPLLTHQLETSENMVLTLSSEKTQLGADLRRICLERDRLAKDAETVGEREREVRDRHQAALDKYLEDSKELVKQINLLEIQVDDQEAEINSLKKSAAAAGECQDAAATPLPARNATPPLPPTNSSVVHSTPPRATVGAGISPIQPRDNARASVFAAANASPGKPLMMLNNVPVTMEVAEEQLAESRRRTEALEKGVFEMMQREQLASVANAILAQTSTPIVPSPSKSAVGNKGRVVYGDENSFLQGIPPPGSIAPGAAASFAADDSEFSRVRLLTSPLGSDGPKSKEQEQAELRAKIAKCQLMIDSLSHRSYFIEDEEQPSRRRGSRRSSRGEKGERHRRSTRKRRSTKKGKIPDSMRVQVNGSTNGLNLSMMTNEDIDIALKMLSTHSQIEQHLREENELLKRELESRQQSSSVETSFDSTKEDPEGGGHSDDAFSGKEGEATLLSDSSSCSSFSRSSSLSSSSVSEGSASSNNDRSVEDSGKDVGGAVSQLYNVSKVQGSPSLGFM